MPVHGAHPTTDDGGAVWFATEVQTLQQQMALLQSALESSKTAVEDFHRRAAENLAASERRYQDLFDNVPVGIYRMSPEGRLLLANPAMVHMLGYTSFEELAARKLSPPWRLVVGAAEGPVLGIERSWRKQNGERITVRESCRVVRDSGGAVLYYEGVVEDISAQKKAVIFERDCRTLLEQVVRNEPLERIAYQIVRLLERQLPGSSCLLLVEQDGYLIPASGSFGSKSCALLPRSLRIAPDGCFCGQAAFRNQVAVAEDVFTHPLWQDQFDFCRAAGIRSCWTMPISTGDGQVAGAVVITRPDIHTPPYAEIEMVQTACRLASVALEHRMMCDNLERQALQDLLTRLPNRAYFESQLARSIEQAEAAGERVALLWIDLDRFKEINDTLGHSAGDDLICEVAERLKPLVQGRSVLARTGGDEFAIILRDISGREEALEMSKKLLAALEAPFQLKGCEIFVSASIGISLYPDHSRTSAELQQTADAAMYRVKAQNGNAGSLYESEIGDRIRERVEIGNHLRRAIERNELELHFQPQIEIGGRLRGFEALVRWRHPTRGLLAPGHFIDTAEATGLIVPIGAWVLQEACKRCAEWNNGRARPLIVAVNVSALQFYFSDLPDVVQKALESSGLPPQCLELELTESLVMRDAQQSARELEKLRSLGVTIAIDDFGTGYSSLSYLQRLPVDLLKIDRSFLEHIDSKSASAVVHAITDLAHALGLRVVAEGIEKDHQFEALRHLGVDLAQGYLIGRPAPAHMVDRIVAGSTDLLSLSA